VVEIDTVIYFQVTNPKSAVYEIENFIMGIEQITITTLRNVVGGIDLRANTDFKRLDQLSSSWSAWMRQPVSGEFASTELSLNPSSHRRQ
jgi:hypothetical protein